MSSETFMGEIKQLILDLTNSFSSASKEVLDHTTSPYKMSKRKLTTFFVTQQVLTDKRILLRIFGHLSSKELFKIRLVNQKWDEVICSVLTSRNSCQIALERGQHIAKGSSGFHKSKNKDLELQHLNELLMEICVNEFPCHRFRFDSGRLDYEDDELLRLFYVYGKRMKELVLLFGCEVSVNFFEQILPLAPNLQVLKFCSIDIRGSRNLSEVLQYPVILHELRTLHFSTSSSYSSERENNAKQILKDILTAAVNLKELTGIDNDYLTVVSKLNKLHLVKTCIVVPSRTYIPTIQQLATQRSTLTKLRITFPFNRRELNTENWEVLSSALSKILMRSKSSLQYLDTIPLCVFSNLNIPPLPKLQCLEICDDNSRFYNQSTHAIFPTVTNFGTNFKNLSVVSLYLKGYYTDVALNGYFPADLYKQSIEDENANDKSPMKIQVNNPFTSVTYLDINYLFTLDEFRIKALASKFPNVKHLRLCCGSAEDLNNSLWFFPTSLESIELHNISVYKNAGAGIDEFSSDTSLHVDSFFTGIPEDMCKTLRLFPRAINDPELIKLLRTKPSVCDMKSLKRLTLHFSKCFSQFISRVSSDYGFKYVPKLRVDYNHKHCNKRCTDDAKDCEKSWDEIRSLFHSNNQRSSVSFCSGYRI